jgi:hypothetical protein
MRRPKVFLRGVFSGIGHVIVCTILVRRRGNIIPTGSQATRPVVLLCSGETMCQGQLELLIDGRRQWVAVAAAYEAGNIVVGFKVGRLYLFVDQSPYGYVPVGTAGRGHSSVSQPPRTQAVACSDSRFFVRLCG